MQRPESELVELSDVVDARYGGKALGLARLAAAGFSVPAAFVIAKADAAGLPAGLEARHARLAGPDGPVAVRSSASGEDGAESSFAGQYESVLGVRGYGELLAAIRHCAASASSERATAYRSAAGISGAMHLVVQEMVDARAAGVVFTADPASGRRDLCVVDAVPGLAESLVDGSASSDHYEVDRAGRIVDRQVAPSPALADDEVMAVVAGARDAEARWGTPLDLEWAIDRAGEIRWLQARPITTLPGDLDEMDSTVAGEDHVYTRCNIGEMMPGAFCPLTASVSGRAIEYAMQMVQVTAGFQDSYREDRWLQLGYFSGHLFLNMTEGTALSSGILGNSLEQYSLSIAGRVVDELVPKPPKPFARRLVNTVRLTAFALSAGRAIRRLDRDLARFEAPSAAEPAALLAELDAATGLYDAATLTHVRSSARSAVAANVLEQTLTREAVRANRDEDEGRSQAAALMAGAADVESAVMLEHLDDVVGRLAADSAEAEAFLGSDAAGAVIRLTGAGGPAGRTFDEFLRRHGHRGYRELCMRDPSWADDPEGLGTIMQAMLRARLLTGDAVRTSPSPQEGVSRAVRVMARLARAGARGREATKSRMVLVAHRLGHGYRLLGERLAATGRLPDADLVFFFDRSELPALVGVGDAGDLIDRAEARRAALPYQARLEFPDVCVGKPVPARPKPPEGIEDGVIAGRSACGGVVEGTVRVAATITQARELRPGEVLVAPVTDVGWTPYFTLIAALVTDIGSSVSHGAVVAREYGVPCVVNTRGATRVLHTGDRVRVDGDRGTVTLLEHAPASS
ncbi:PEP/pyruvate-binding domain-containing protein [Actinomadura sp. 7K507]|uniref:PEP/pyruvate-binding domain-containing protein n=1 Tax=Actinomadura sp. 7K507 TaxID=2530365 RepID=UPI00104CF2E6|nr:PEP/pyruvate-binding domain-containing protein [Actinomadura sp. 7K507]TDC77394.1 pyruvate, water dikinase [Actinomadura sp. 7K507]